MAWAELIGSGTVTVPQPINEPCLYPASCKFPIGELSSCSMDLSTGSVCIDSPCPQSLGLAKLEPARLPR